MNSCSYEQVRKRIHMQQVEEILRINGLRCSECAGKIERRVGMIPGVLSCEISLVLSSMKIRLKSELLTDETIGQIQSIADQIEPGTKVSRQNVPEEFFEDRSAEGETPGDGIRELSRLRTRIFAGAFFFISALLFVHVFHVPEYVSLGVFVVSYLILGISVLVKAITNLTHGRIFDENFLMSVATIGAFFINSPEEAVAVMLFYQVGEAFQMSALYRSKKSVRELLSLRPDSANLKTEKGTVSVSPARVQVGDVIVIKPGERVPLDAVVLSGNAMMDTSALTGESVPREAGPGDTLLSGVINLDGVLEAQTTAIFSESTASKMIALVTEAASRKSKSETIISRFARIYTPVVVISAVLLVLIPVVFFRGSLSEWLYRSLSFLVISCPCALVLSVPLGYFGGIGAAGKNGVFVKGGSVLDSLAAADTIVFDKTGTLTEGRFSVTKLVPAETVSEDELLKKAVTAERYSDHPAAQAVLREAMIRKIPADDIEPSKYREIAGRGVRVDDPAGVLVLGNRKLMMESGIERLPVLKETGTILYAAEGTRYLGALVLSDTPRAGAAEAISQLRTLGVKRILMLTGDHSAAAGEVASGIGIDEYAAELLPEQKLEELEKLFKNRRDTKQGTILFAGDGINDAPVLARADAGIAMGLNASGAAVEAADLVIMKEDIHALPTAVAIAKKTRRIVAQSIWISLAVKSVILIMAAFGMTNLWLAVFADVGVTLIAVMNALRAGRV
jgi:Cd2+/Zn2+-exporting ATPase